MANYFWRTRKDKPRLKFRGLMWGLLEIRGAMAQRKKFRIDQFRADQLKAVAGAPLAPDVPSDAMQRHHELILEIRSLRS